MAGALNPGAAPFIPPSARPAAAAAAAAQGAAGDFAWPDGDDGLNPEAEPFQPPPRRAAASPTMGIVIGTPAFPAVACAGGGALDPSATPFLPDRLDPRGIRFSQQKILPYFSNGRHAGESIERAAALLRDGKLQAADFPRIKVFRWAEGAAHGSDQHTRRLGVVFSSDNRRLWAFRAAGLESVPVQWVTFGSVDPGKLSTWDGGVAVQLAARSWQEREADSARRSGSSFAGGSGRLWAPAAPLKLVRKQGSPPRG